MNKIKRACIAATIFIITFLAYATPPALLVGCGSGCASVQEGSDPVVVHAEQVAAGSFEILDAYVFFENNNRDRLRAISPDFEKAANQIRRDGKKAIEGLRSATKVYKAARTSDNKATLETYIALVAELKRIAQVNLASANLNQ